MTTAVSLSITLGGGLLIDGGPQRVKRQFRAAWGKTEVFAAQRMEWDLLRERSWQHRTAWSIGLARHHRSVYGLRVERQSQQPYGDLQQHRRSIALAYDDAPRSTARHQVAYGDFHTIPLRAAIRLAYGYPYLCMASHRSPYADQHAAAHRSRLALPYSERRVCRAQHRASFAFRTGCRSVLVLSYWLKDSNAAHHRLGYAVTDVDPVARRFAAPWSLLEDARLQAVVNIPELVWAERRIRILSATLSCDEDSPVWMARIEIAALSDFAAVGIGDMLTLALGAEVFALVVDGKTLSRNSATDAKLEITALSPLALLDAPFAGAIRRHEAEPISAHAAVASLIGPVDWQLPDWIIPANRLMLDGATPLAAARHVVAAIGGIVESNPDGSVVCRRRHPVSIPQYGQAGVAHSLFDRDVLSAQARIAPGRGFNRVTIANEDGATAASADRLEFVAADAFEGQVRAYLASVRPVVLAHTGRPATVIAAFGEQQRVETETVEFIEGRATTRYPVAAIVGLDWQHAVLGDVTASDTRLEAATAGYSLLRITYATESMNWRVSLTADEEVQFVLIDP
jgi:hypothetical protein